MRRFRRPRSPVHTARRVAAGLLTALALVLALRPAPAPATDAAPPAVAVVVAGRDLAAGTGLSAPDLVVARLPPEFAPTGSVRDPADLAGRVLAGSVRAGEPLTDVRLVGAGLTALLEPGQVAAPVRLADLAVAALVRTGDRVDVLASPPEADRAETVVAGALVLAAGASGKDGAPAATDPADGLILVAVDGATAARLAAAAASSTLTVTLTPP
jgi:Flp pilus assembly protein CpaB